AAGLLGQAFDLVTSGHWRGPAGERFLAAWDELSGGLRVAVLALRTAAGGLAELGGRLERAQADWDRAPDTARGRAAADEAAAADRSAGACFARVAGIAGPVPVAGVAAGGGGAGGAAPALRRRLRGASP